MRKLLIAIVLLLSAISCKAQTRAYVGVEGQGLFGNYGVGPTASLEIPLKRFELQVGASYEPIASHIKLGSGYNYRLSTTGIGWFSNTWGLYGGLNDSTYKAGTVYKNQPHVFGGFVYRNPTDGHPIRIFFGYTREIQNGISANGTETNHLNAFSVNYQIRPGCSGSVCFRLEFDNYVGWTLNQGNPVCDGTYGPGTCPRQKALGGGAAVGFSLEFPRRRDHEGEAF